MARDRKAADGKYYKIAGMPLKRAPDFFGLVAMTAYKLLGVPVQWLSSVAAIEECAKKEDATWVIKVLQKCPHCSDKSCASVVGRKALFLEYRTAHTKIWDRLYSKNLVKEPSAFMKSAPDFGQIRYQALPFEQYRNGYCPTDDFALYIYQCITHRDKLYLLEVPKEKDKKNPKFLSKFWVDNWKNARPPKSCPLCTAPFEKIEKVMNYVRDNIEKYFSDPENNYYTENMLSPLIKAVYCPPGEEINKYADPKIDSDCGVYYCSTCRNIFSIRTDPSEMYKFVLLKLHALQKSLEEKQEIK